MGKDMFENSDYHAASPDTVQSKIGAGLNQGGDHYAWPDQPVYFSFNARYTTPSHFNTTIIFLPLTGGFLSDAFTVANQAQLSLSASDVGQSLLPLIETFSHVAGLL